VTRRARWVTLRACWVTLTQSRLVVNVNLPLVWLATVGGGGGLHSVDDLEVNFMEQESVR
jgi:hydroxymethylglutaryl-CoA reductase